MTVEHGGFTIERHLAAPPARVFALWSDPAKKRRWFVDSDGPAWTEADYALDFRVGGTERGRFTATDGPAKGVHENATHFLDIVPDERIAFAYTMAFEGRIHSASLATVTFEADGGGTRLTFTEQAAHFPPSDGEDMRKAGWTHLLNALTKELETERA